MDIRASLRFLRIAPRKVRLVADLIRGMNVVVAEQQLAHMAKASALPMLKLLQSAKANAKHNFKLDPDTLVISSLLINEGPALRRYMPRAQGRADVFKRRSSHIMLTLSEPKKMAPTKNAPAVLPAVKKKKPVVAAKKPAAKKEATSAPKKTRSHSSSTKK